MIGVFDSGIGGLAVLGELQHRWTFYVADQGFGMYGERSLDEVRQRSEALTARLLEEGAEAIVVACNSASAAALTHLRSVWAGVPFVGMEPAVRPAASLSRNGTIGVLATTATFQGELFASVVDRFATDHRFVETACPGLAAAIEDDDPVIDDLIDEYVGQTLTDGADVIVLGCTHYSLVSDRIAAKAGQATVIDPAPAVARQTMRVVEPSAGQGSFFTTGDPQRFGAQLDRLGFDAGGVGSFSV